MVPNFDKIIWPWGQNQLFGRLVNKGNISNSIIMCFNLQFLPYITWRDDIIGLIIGEIMSIGWFLSGSNIIIIFNTIRILISNHFRSDRPNLFIINKIRYINNSYISILISKYQLTSNILLYYWVCWCNISNLWWFLNTVHILPLSQQFVWILQVIFRGKNIYSSFYINYYDYRQGINK